MNIEKSELNLIFKELEKTLEVFKNEHDSITFQNLLKPITQTILHHIFIAPESLLKIDSKFGFQITYIEMMRQASFNDKSGNFDKFNSQSFETFVKENHLLDFNSESFISENLSKLLTILNNKNQSFDKDTDFRKTLNNLIFVFFNLFEAFGFDLKSKIFFTSPFEEYYQNHLINLGLKSFKNLYLKPNDLNVDKEDLKFNFMVSVFELLNFHLSISSGSRNNGLINIIVKQIEEVLSDELEEIKSNEELKTNFLSLKNISKSLKKLHLS